MGRRSWMGAPAVAAILLGCNSTGHQDVPGSASAGPCDGTGGIRRAIAVSGQVGRALSYSAVQLELGYQYIYVDGTCRYWVSPTWSGGSLAVWGAIHEGVLTSEEASQIGNSIRYGDTGAFSTQCPSSTSVHDSPPIYLYNGEQVEVCWPDAELIQSALLQWNKLFPSLYSRGTPVDGALRIEVGISSVLPTWVPTYSWPIESSIEDFVVDPQFANAVGVSFKIEDAASVAALLSLRSQFIKDCESLNTAGRGIPLSAGYSLFMREELPFTDVHGLFAPVQPQ